MLQLLNLPTTAQQAGKPLLKDYIPNRNDVLVIRYNQMEKDSSLDLSNMTEESKKAYYNSKDQRHVVVAANPECNFKFGDIVFMPAQAMVTIIPLYDEIDGELEKLEFMQINEGLLSGKIGNCAEVISE